MSDQNVTALPITGDTPAGSGVAGEAPWQLDVWVREALSENEKFPPRAREDYVGKRILTIVFAAAGH
jgi:hypothetical protein